MRAVLVMLALLFFFSAPSTASVCNQAVKPHLGYINGVWNDKPAANKNRKAIEDYLTTQNLRSRFGKVVLLYNESHGPVQDLYDVLVQKEQESPTVWNKVKTLLVRISTTNLGALVDAIAKADPDLTSVVSVLSSNIKNAVTMKDYVDSDFALVHADLSAALADGGNILLMPHSQGNLYANRLYQLFQSTGRYVSIAGIASPASTQPVGGYVTSENDGVINWLRSMYSVLPANSNLPRNPDGSMGHTLAFDYLGTPKGQEDIAAMIARLAPAAVSKTVGAELPITLSWSDSSPLTLWVDDNGLQAVPGIGGTATYTVCNPQNFTFYFAWASTADSWPTVATLSAGDKSAVVNLSAGNDLNLWGDMITRRLAGSVFLDQYGVVAGVQ